jgi:hypothetical protein
MSRGSLFGTRLNNHFIFAMEAALSALRTLAMLFLWCCKLEVEDVENSPAVVSQFRVMDWWVQVSCIHELIISTQGL